MKWIYKIARRTANLMWTVSFRYTSLLRTVCLLSPSAALGLAQNKKKCSLMTSLDPKEKPGPLQDNTTKSSRLLACAATLGIIYNRLYMWHPCIQYSNPYTMQLTWVVNQIWSLRFPVSLPRISVKIPVALKTKIRKLLKSSCFHI